MKGYLAVLGGNLLACAAIQRLRDRGHRVLVVDGNADSPAKAIADLFIHQNFYEVAGTRIVLARIGLTGVLPLNDFAVASASVISRERGLPGWSESAQALLTSKIKLKQTWLAGGVSTARAAYTMVTDALAGKVAAVPAWPIVVKPSFSGGGSRGVFVAHNWQQVIAGLAVNRTKYLDDGVVMEEYIPGTEHTMEVLVHQGHPFLLSISDKENYPGSDTVVQNLYFPGPIGNSHRPALEALAYKACREMKLTNGTVHLEAILRDGVGYLIDAGGRPGGGPNFHPICELSTGYDYPDLLSSVLTGKDPDFKRGSNVNLAWHYLPYGSGILRGVDGLEAVRAEADVVDAQIHESIGRPRAELTDDLSRPGYVLVKGDATTVKARAAGLLKRIKLIT